MQEQAGIVKPIYKRILLKMSGGALTGGGQDSIDPATLDRMATEINEVQGLGVEVAIVVGGGNFFRGSTLSEAGISRMTGDYMGMLSTLINAIALRDSFERFGVPVRILSAIPMSGICDHFNQRKAIHHLEMGRLVIFAAGTGNPLVTTDSAASLRGIEVEADVIIKATDVDGIFDKDPRKHADAKCYKKLSFQEALDKELAVMDLAAFCQCRDHNKDIRVINMHKPGTLLRAVSSLDEGTLVTNGDS
jgi:uridylate kinase